MPESIQKIAEQIQKVVSDLDHESLVGLRGSFVSVIRKTAPTEAEKPVKSVLQGLRRKRFFTSMDEIASAYLGPGPGGSPEVQLQLIQALIDQGKLKEAEYELLDMSERKQLDARTGAEVWGLLGRVNKQAYINARDRTGAVRRALRQSIHAYLKAYRVEEDKNWWQGINAVACLARAERDGISPGEFFDAKDSLPDWKAEALKVLSRAGSYTKTDDDFTWAMATATEACIALERHQEANRFCELYIESDWADVFELGSTERQLREVWELDRRNVPGAQVLSIIQGRLGKLGGEIEALTQSDLKFQAQLGKESSRAIRWLETLLKRANSVARIYKETDDTVGGTGFLIKQGDLEGSSCGQLFIVTNHHVVNSQGERGAIRPEAAIVEFTRAHPNMKFRLKEVCWSSRELDATICSLQPDSDRELGLPTVRKDDLKQNSGQSHRLYVMGHPQGAPLQISLYDNHLIDMDETTLRYRSPTEKGSSGSPVLTEDLGAVAVHHATRTAEPANQGVFLDAISARIREEGGLKKEK